MNLRLTKPHEANYAQLNVDFEGFSQRSQILYYDMPQTYGQMSMLELSIISRMGTVHEAKADLRIRQM